jgi:hypothetical protein
MWWKRRDLHLFSSVSEIAEKSRVSVKLLTRGTFNGTRDIGHARLVFEVGGGVW